MLRRPVLSRTLLSPWFLISQTLYCPVLEVAKGPQSLCSLQSRTQPGLSPAAWTRDAAACDTRWGRLETRSAAKGAGSQWATFRELA